MQRFCPVAEKILTCEGKTTIKIAYPSLVVVVDDALYYPFVRVISGLQIAPNVT